MHTGLVKSVIVLSVLIFGITGIEYSFAQSTSGDNSGDNLPIPEGNVTDTNPIDSGTGPIPEDNSTYANLGTDLSGSLGGNSTIPNPEQDLSGSLNENNTGSYSGGPPSPAQPSPSMTTNGTTNEDAKTAMQNSEKIIQQLQQNVNQLQKPLQSILSDLQSGQYYGPTMNGDSITKSYDISFTGSAVSKDSPNPSNVSGEIFLQNMITGDSVIKFKVTGGHIEVGSTSYDLAFGKARVTYSSEGVKESMTILAHGTDSTGKEDTVRLLLQSSSPLEGDYGSTPVTVTVQSPQSQINGNWSLSGNGQLSLVPS